MRAAVSFAFVLTFFPYLLCKAPYSRGDPAICCAGLWHAAGASTPRKTDSRLLQHGALHEPRSREQRRICLPADKLKPLLGEKG
ncbi:hypothetical protein AWB68_03018 [Caballeronia choica]|jgi:hypothetical protein|uniref:Uncharacterized protein n=1 Tax=Caballeronia choica TaxID=326476 RepID=A0A158IUT7_9BURK|nr:hypothetical protein AWB68_03018 [Caballeronia choica]